jgi:hypothetical protein
MHVLLAASIGVVGWQQYQALQLEGHIQSTLAEHAREIQKLKVAVAPFETVNSPDLLPIQSGKTRSELHGPRGPMPVSILTKSAPLPGEPPPGTDVTSNIKQAKVNPCAAPCRRLSDCALDPTLCPEMDTRQHDRVFEVCMEACGRVTTIKDGLAGVTECSKGVLTARTRIPEFSSLCGTSR